MSTEKNRGKKLGFEEDRKSEQSRALLTLKRRE